LIALITFAKVIVLQTRAVVQSGSLHVVLPINATKNLEANALNSAFRVSLLVATKNFAPKILAASAGTAQLRHHALIQ